MSHGALTESRFCARAIPDSQWSAVTSLWQSQPWVADARRTIARVSDLGHNWDGQGSPPPSRTALETMSRLIKEIDAYELPTAHLGPVSGGGLGVEWRNGERDLTLEIMPDGSIEFLKAERTPSGLDLNHMDDGVISGDRLGDVRALIRWLLGS